METPVLVQFLKSGILSSTSFHMEITFCGGGGDAVEQSSCKAEMVAQGNGNFSS